MEETSPVNAQNSPTASSSTVEAVQSPARGSQMVQTLRQKLRAPPLEHTWVFWHDRQKTGPQAGAEGYVDRMTELHTISDVRDFWEVWNNFDVDKLPMRDSVHLFHKGVKPIWEDERNALGGSWTFRIAKDQAAQFWKEVALLAIGGALQEAVTGDRVAFRDDICGISYSVRFAACNISIWNRDAEHKEGVNKVLETVLSGIGSELRPKESAYYYKPHFEHRDFQTKAKEKKAGPGSDQPGSSTELATT